jgi:hypothetical protein
MLYKRLERKRKSDVSRDGAEHGRLQPREKRGGGTRFTVLSFLVIGICLLFIKMSNPGADMRAPVLMLVTIGLGCAIMSYISRRM